MSASTASPKTGAKGAASTTSTLPPAHTTSTHSAPPVFNAPTTTAIRPGPNPITQHSSLSSRHAYNEDGKGGDMIVNVDDVNPSHSNLTFNPQQPQPLVTKANALHLYQSALGIPPPKPPKVSKKKNTRDGVLTGDDEHRLLTDKNKGVYHQVIINERWERYKYVFCNVFITVAMFLQIVLAAAVTAFGAGQSSHVLITVFGAANTALASLLAVLKSQGLPNRIRQDWNGWRDLREHIEEMEREIEVVVSGRVEGEKLGKEINQLRVWDIVKEIEARYNAVRLTAEANRPDTYIKVPVAIK